MRVLYFLQAAVSTSAKSQTEKQGPFWSIVYTKDKQYGLKIDQLKTIKKMSVLFPQTLLYLPYGRRDLFLFLSYYISVSFCFPYR